jgi:hypothetical protein
MAKRLRAKGVTATTLRQLAKYEPLLQVRAQRRQLRSGCMTDATAQRNSQRRSTTFCPMCCRTRRAWR